METVLAPPNTPAFERNCPIRLVLDRIADKWTVMMMSMLADGMPGGSTSCVAT